MTPPAQRVQFILGEDQDGDSGHEPHPLFSEMEELCLDEDGEMEWKETARWVKFEEDVEVSVVILPFEQISLFLPYLRSQSGLNSTTNENESTWCSISLQTWVGSI